MESVDYRALLAEGLPVVRARIAEAERAAGRAEGSVRLVAVTKAHPVAALEAALAAGLTDLGENRVEELTDKVGVLGADSATWHMIGHVQSRKAAAVADLADLVHSVDSVKLAARFARVGEARGRPVCVLAQVNTSGEVQKSGFPMERAVEDIHRLAELEGLRVDGLMTMAPFVEDELVLAKAFGGLRKTLEGVSAAAPGVGTELSMGMTNDLDIAIREGSTIVRIGTALFGQRVRGPQ